MIRFKAIATNYKGITFRSRLEARVYDYLLNTTENGLSIIYEPNIEGMIEWTPDFGIFDNFKEEYTLLIEVKPKNNFFDVLKYLILAESVMTDPKILCFSPDIIIEFGRVGFKAWDIDDVLWAQSFNNLKHELNEI